MHCVDIEEIQQILLPHCTESCDLCFTFHFNLPCRAMLPLASKIYTHQASKQALRLLDPCTARRLDARQSNNALNKILFTEDLRMNTLRDHAYMNSYHPSVICPLMVWCSHDEIQWNHCGSPVSMRLVKWFRSS